MGKAKQQLFPGFGVESAPSKPSPPKRSTAPKVELEAISGGPTVFSADDLQGKTVYVIDSHALIYQVFHALGEMTSPDGKPVNAIYGFTRDILDIISRRKPDLLFCCFDHSDTTFRNEIFDQYKANRDPMPDDLRSQIPEIQKVLRSLAIPILTVPNYEADDIMATLSQLIDDHGGRCVLVTSDKDCRQLITENVCLYNMRKNMMYRAQHLATDWGIRPDQVVDFQAMVGDSVDNVPGIPTIGPKTAMQLLQEFETLDGVLENVEQIKGKKSERIRESADQARMSRELVQLDRNVPMDLEWSEGCIGGMDIQEAIELCNQFGFRSLVDRVSDLAPLAAPVAWESEYRTIDTVAELEKLAEDLSQKSYFAFDTETSSPSPRWAEMVGFSFAWEPGKAVYVPIQAPQGQDRLDLAQAIRVLQPVFENEQILKIGQNLKYDMVVLRNIGIELKGPLFDTMVADYLLEPGRTSHGIDELALRYFNHRTIKIKDLIGSGKKQITMDQVDVDDVTQYAAEDADIPLRLYEPLLEKLKQRELLELFENLEMPLVQVLAEMEFNGITVETDSLTQLSDQFQTKLEELQKRIFELAGHDFNIDSPSQLATVLFDELRLAPVKRTKTGRSTDVAVLSQLAEKHELPAEVIEYRQYAKLKNTYTDVLVRLVHPGTKRVHTSFMQDVARTGRLSSKDPNLQNIPVRTEMGRRIRNAFVARSDDWRLICADYSQIELRVLAHLSGDQALTEAFVQGKDIHRSVAARVNGVEESEVTTEMRRQAKAVNFGIIYGQSPFGLAREIGLTKDDAADFIDHYFRQYPAVDEFINSVLEDASKNGCVKTLLNRQRPVEGVRNPATKPNPSRIRNSAERIAINTVIQGSAADLIKMAMIRVYEKLETSELRGALLLQIHDELVVECHQEDQVSIVSLVEQEMVAACDLRVPVLVDTNVGSKWGGR